VHVRVGDLRSVIREEFLHGVPEWQLRKDASDFTDTIRDRITSYVLLNKSENGVDRAEAIQAMNDVCDALEQKVYDVLEDQLFAFTRRI
jgi:hypothetical protein